MYSRLFASGFAACALAAPTFAQTISAIPALSVPHSILDFDDAGAAGPISLLALRLAGTPCSVGIANLSFSSSGGSDGYDFHTSRGRALGWSGSGLTLVDVNGSFTIGNLRIDLSTLCTEIGFGIGDYADGLVLDFYRGANLLASTTTSPISSAAQVQRFRMSGNSFDRVDLRRIGSDGFVITDLYIETGIEVSELPFFPGLHSTIDMDTVGAAGATNLAALNAAGTPMPANLRNVALTANGQPLSVYDVNTTQGRALARNANNQIALVNPSGVYQPFHARFDVARAQAFGISIGDWTGSFALEFYDGNALLETVITGNTTSANPRYFYMSGASFDRVDVHALDPQARWVIPAIHVQTAANDCCDAIPVFAGTSATHSSVGASTSQPVWTCGSGGNDVWFRYVAPCSGNARFETCGLASFDTTMEIFTGPCSNLSSLACNDDGCASFSSRIDLAVEMGRSYLVRVGGFSGATGAFSLRIEETPSNNGSFFGIGASCGNVGLQASGNPTIGGSVQYSLSNVEGLPFLLLGLSQINFPLCSAGCSLRVLPDLGSLQTGTLQAAIPCDPLLVGAVFFVQGVDYGGSAGCSAGAPAQLSTTQLILTTIG
ncbi:MAG: hypothetical protein JNM84_05210 [Planctomycetes bacterium]|nr:hypothetical protein [Planctomycetota bacterium]